MKLSLISICFFLVAGLLLTCRQAEPEPDRLLDGTPRLKSISFSGIPQENISIDQATKVISVIMPASIPNHINIVVELTDNAEWLNNQLSVWGGDLFGCDSCFHIYLKDKNDPSTQSRIDYRVRPLAAASPTIDFLSAPFTYFIRNANFTTLEIPMLHLYGNRLPKEARITHDKTGEVVIIKRDRLYHVSKSNKLGLYLYDAKLIPGSYRIDLVLDEGTTLKVPQPVLVAPGTASFDYQSKTSFGYRVAVGKTLTIDGYNLFKEDITLYLVDKQNQIHLLPGLVFDPYGRQIQASIPATLPPGQYAVRFWQNDIRLPYGYCLRVNVLKDEQERPFIGTIGNDFIPCSLRDPVPVQRGVTVALTSNLYQQALVPLSRRAALKLSSLTGNDVYYGPVIAHDGNRMDSNSLTIPATVPSGLYTAILQVLDAQNNVVAESEPYGRILDVK